MKRRILGGIFSLILLVCSILFAPTALAAGDYDIVRVKISIGSPTEKNIFIDGNYSLDEDAGVSLPRQLYTIKINGSNLELYYSTNLLYSGEKLTFIQHEATSGLNNLIFMERLYSGESAHYGYLGDMHFDISGGAIRAINHIYIEEYIYGVVPHEMGYTPVSNPASGFGKYEWPGGALEAQAIAARNYAVNQIEAFEGSAYYLGDTSGNQVYKGYEDHYSHSETSVNNTAKQVAKSASEIISIYYSASNGGQVDIPQHVWSSSNPLMPYHIIHDDPYDIANPYSSQEVIIFPKAITAADKIKVQASDDDAMVDRTGSEAANAELYLKTACLSAVAAKGYIAGVSGDVEIVGINTMNAHTHEGQHGGEDDYDGNDYAGNNPCTVFTHADVNMTVEAQRYAEGGAQPVMLGDCNFDSIINIADYTLIRLHILGLKALEGAQLTAADIDKDGIINIADYTLVRLDILGLKAITQDPNPGQLITEEVTVDFTIDMHEFDKDGGQYEAFHRSLRKFTIEETATSWNLYHRRYGHGLGLSQRGAQQMGNTVNPSTGVNFTGQEIVEFYYPTATFETLTYSKDALPVLGTAPNNAAANAVIDCETSMNVRSSASSGSSANIVGRLPDGCRVEVTGTSGDWYQINYGETAAFLHGDYVVLDP